MDTPSVPDAFQSVIHLGAARKVYRVGRLTAAGTFIGSAVVAVIILLMLVFAALAPFAGGDPGARIAGPLFLGGVGLILGFWFLKEWKRSMRTLRTTAVLYGGGFAVSFGGDEPAAFAWNDIRQLTVRITQQTIYGIIPAGRTCRFRIAGETAGTVELSTPIGGVEQLYRAIHAAVMPRISAALLRNFQEGKTLVFGPVAVDRSEGLRMKDRVLSWDAIRNIRLESGNVFIYPKSGGWFGTLMYDAGDIPNLEALMLICREAAKAHTA